MRQIRLLLAFILLALALSLPSTTARADGPNYSDPVVVQNLVHQLRTAGDRSSQVWAAFPPEARQAITEYNKVVRLETTRPEKGTATSMVVTGCLDPINGITGYNYLNQPLFSFFLEIYYCYNGTNITSHSNHAWGVTDYPGSLWTYDGIRSESQSGGDQQSYFYYYAQGAFSYCVFGYCAQHSYPWLWLRVHGNGTSEGDGGFG